MFVIEMRFCHPTIVTLMLCLPLLSTADDRASEKFTIEVFSASGLTCTAQSDHRLQGDAVSIYSIDGLDQLESALSASLPTSTQAAMDAALFRIRNLNELRITPAKQAAIGLAKASQYGINRYPAIVFNGSSVVYGVTGLAEAIDTYEAWQRAQLQ